MKKFLILIPTYNEKENVEKILSNILKLRLNADILFMDDNSPDGTGKILDKLSKKNKKVNVVHRSGKMGIGSAHHEGIKYAYENKYDTLITMDCDFTHPPEHIIDLINNSKGYDIVVGSRYMMKNSLDEWNISRKILTNLGHFLTRILLRMKYDATGAFRLYNLKQISPYVFSLVSSLGYSFFYESLFILNFNNYKINEIPIKLPARTYGHSKMKFKDAWQSLQFLFSIYINYIFNKEKYINSEPFIINKNKKKFVDNQNWDQYWQNQKSTGGLVYDAVAAFYRKFIIKRNLNYYLNKYIHIKSEILHSGCGSGQVDADLVDKYKITAMDISINALSFYKKLHNGKCTLVYGDIFMTQF